MRRALKACRESQQLAQLPTKRLATVTLNTRQRLDELLHCVARPADVQDVVTALSGTTFVQVGKMQASHGCSFGYKWSSSAELLAVICAAPEGCTPTLRQHLFILAHAQDRGIVSLSLTCSHLPLLLTPACFLPRRLWRRQPWLSWCRCC